MSRKKKKPRKRSGCKPPHDSRRNDDVPGWIYHPTKGWRKDPVGRRGEAATLKAKVKQEDMLYHLARL